MGQATVKVGVKKKNGKSKAKPAVTASDGQLEAAAQDAHAESEAEVVDVKRPDFDTSTAVDVDGTEIPLDDNGRMTALPLNWTRKFKGLRRGDFTTKLLYNEFKLYLLDKQIGKLNGKREEMVADIEDIRKGGDPKNAKIRKVKKLADQFAQMLAALAEDGITAADLGISLPMSENTE